MHTRPQRQRQVTTSKTTCLPTPTRMKTRTVVRRSWRRLARVSRLLVPPCFVSALRSRLVVLRKRDFFACVCVCVSAHVYALAFLFAHVLHSLFFGVVVHMLRFASSHRPSSSDTSQRSDGRINNARHRCVEHEAKELPEHAGGPSGRPSRPA